MLRGFGRVRAVALALLMVTTVDVPALALPTDGTIAAGTGQIAADGASVTQESAKLIIDWTDFSIGAGETFVFQQPDASAVVLNRVIGGNSSEIMGALEANGQVFLVNPQGIVFGRDATVDAAGLVASTLALRDEDFLSGDFYFRDGAKAGAVENEGTVVAKDGGYVVFLGAQVTNAGDVLAPGGTVALGAGAAIGLDMFGDGLVVLRVDGPIVGALVENSGLLAADGGRVSMGVSAIEAARATVLNQDGVVRARSVGSVDGHIVLEGGAEGTVSIAGTLETVGATVNEAGGTTFISGENVVIRAGAEVQTSYLTLYGAGEVDVSGTIVAFDDARGSNVIVEAGESITINAPIVVEHEHDWLLSLSASRVVINKDVSIILRGDSGDSTVIIRNYSNIPSSAVASRSITIASDASLSARNIRFGGSDGSVDVAGSIQAERLEFRFGGVLSELTLSNPDNFTSGLFGTPSVYFYGAERGPLTVSGEVQLRSAGDIELRGNVTADALTVEAKGNVVLEDIGSEFDPIPSSLHSDGNIVLAATDGGVFINRAGAGVLQGNGRKIIYSSSADNGFVSGGLGYDLVGSVAYPNDPRGQGNVIYTLSGIAELIITADSILDWIYSKTLPTFTASYSLADHDVSSVGFRIEGGDGINVGTYTIVPYGASSSRYSLKYVPGTLKVNPRPLTLTAHDVAIVFGEVKPDLTYSVTGLATGDRAEDVLDNVKLNTIGTKYTEVGTYSISFSFDEKTSDANYYIKERRAGTLTVTKRPLMITVYDQRWAYPYEPMDFRGEWIIGGPPSSSEEDERFIRNSFVGRLSFIVPENKQPGTYPLELAVNSYLEHNFVIAYSPGTLIIEPPPPPTWVQPIEVRVAGHTAEAWDVVRSAIDGFLRTGGRAMGLTHDQMFQALKNGDKQAASQILPHLVAELGTIFQTDESNLTAAQRAFLAPFQQHVQAERIAAAEKQLNDFYADKAAGRHITDYGRFVGQFGGVGRVSTGDPLLVVAQLESSLKLQLANARKPVTFGDLQAMWGTEAGGQLVQLLLTQLGL